MTEGGENLQVCVVLEGSPLGDDLFIELNTTDISAYIDSKSKF